MPYQPDHQYCCNVGAHHVKGAQDPSIRVIDDGELQRWVLCDDMVLASRAAAAAVGGEQLKALAAQFKTLNELVKS